MLIAGAVALVIAGVVLLVAINHKTFRGGEPDEVPLDISARPPGMGENGEIADLAAQATGRFQAVDKDDPTRVAWELVFSKLDPVGAGVYRLTEPKAWIYTKDGQAIFVRADTGQIKKPAAVDGQVESGTFTGNVVAMVFPAPKEGDEKHAVEGQSAEGLKGQALGAGPGATDVGAAGAGDVPMDLGTASAQMHAASANAKVWDPDRDRPWLVGVTDEVQFDTVLLEMTTSGPVRISTVDAQFDTASMIVRGNQVKNRLESLLCGPGTLRYTTASAKSEKKEEAEEKPASAAKPAPAAGGEKVVEAPAPVSKPPAPAKALQQDWYKVAVSESVVVLQSSEGRKVNADLLELFVRTIDNKLPGGTFGVDEGESAVALGGVSAARRDADDGVNVDEVHSDAMGSLRAMRGTRERDELLDDGVNAGVRVRTVAWQGPVVPASSSSAQSSTSPTPPTAATSSASAAVNRGGNGQGAKNDAARAEIAEGHDAPAAGAGGSGSVGEQPVFVDARPSATAYVRGERRTLFKARGDDVVLTWTGKLNATPQGSEPKELAEANHLFGRFTAAKTGRVRFKDQSMGVIGECGVVEYAATPRVVTMTASPASGVPSAPAPGAGAGNAEGTAAAMSTPTGIEHAWVYLPDSGYYVGTHVTARLRTGEVNMLGTGMLASGAKAPSETTENGAMVFGPAPLIVAPRLGTESAPTDDTRRIVWGERAHFVFGARRGMMSSDLRNAEFIGDVRAQDKQSKISGTHLAADFTRSVAASSNIAGGSDADRGTNVGRRKTPNIRMDGAGKFEHAQALKDTEKNAAGGDADHFEVTWTDSMTFNDDAGQIECNGGTVATATGPLVLDVIKASSVRLDLARDEDLRRAGINTSSSQNGNGGDELVGDRRILRAEAIGTKATREDGTNATVESRRYSLASGAETPGGKEGESRKLDQVMYLEGPRIIADEVDGIVRVPSAGRALFMDQRVEGAASGSGGVASSGDFRGTTRFTWAKSMLFTRGTGVIDLAETVEMVHKPLDNQPFARLTCDALQAQVGTGSQGVPGSAAAGVRAGRLIDAVATGNVYIESGDRKKLVAERATYDAVRSIVEATASGDNAVTLFDEQSAAPQRARKMRWEIASDRIEISEPAPITVPR